VTPPVRVPEVVSGCLFQRVEQVVGSPDVSSFPGRNFPTTAVRRIARELEAKMNRLFLAGRILLGGYYLYSAAHHFMAFDRLTAVVAAHHVPVPGLAVALSGLLLLVAGVSFLLGVVPRLGTAAVVAFLLPVTLIMHAFWTDADPQARMSNLINFTKNLALLGSSLMFLAIPEPWPYSVHLRATRHARASA
jgi:putative oxidoreductase